jgi:hypothetical protein
MLITVRTVNQAMRGIHLALCVSKPQQFIFHPLMDGSTQFLL